MSRSHAWPASAAVVFLLLAIVVAMPAAHATHEWGHRFMFYGRVLDSEGEPAQKIILWASVKTTNPDTLPEQAKPHCIGNPCVPVETDCNGLYYTYNNGLQADVAVALGLERTAPSGTQESGYVMHIHNSALPSNARFRLATDYGNATGRVDEDLKFKGVDFTLDKPVPKSDTCTGDPDAWKTTYVVTGHIQIDDGNRRIDVMPHAYPGRQSEVTVRLETANNGTQTKRVITNAWADYRAEFDNVTVEEGAKVTVEWNNNVETRNADTTYRVTATSIVDSDSIARTALIVFAWVVGGLVVVGAAVWGFGKVRQNIEHKRLMGQGLRKRANR